MIETRPNKPKTQTQPQINASPAVSRLPLLVGLGVSLVSLLVYILTLSPTVNFLDSGELITVGVRAGIAHPSGYPLYTLLIILGGALPFSDPAVGVNLISALAGALAVGLFYALVYETIVHYLYGAVTGESVNGRVPLSNRAARRAERSTAANKVRDDDKVHLSEPDTSPSTDWGAVFTSAGAALLLALSFSFWSWSTQAKMYTLHFAFVAGLLLLALKARTAVRGAGSPRLLWNPRLWPAPARLLVFLAAGLGLTFTNHFMSVALLPSLALLLFWPQPPIVTEVRGRAVQPDAPLWRWLLAYIPWLLVAGLVPLLLYLYLPLRSAQVPPMNWGSPSTWGDFWRHVTLWQFRTSIGSKESFFESFSDFLGETVSRATTQLGPWLGVVVLSLIIAGLIRLARTSLPLLTATVLLVLATLAATFNLEFAEIAAYSVPMYMMFILWAAVGLHWLLVAIESKVQNPKSEVQDARPATLGFGLWTLIPIGLAALALLWNVGRAGHAKDHLADAYIHNQFKNFAPNAVVITNNWYLTSPGYYLQLVRNERPDVAIINRDLIQYPFYLDHVNHEYPEVMGTVKDLSVPFAYISRQWVDDAPIDVQQWVRLLPKDYPSGPGKNVTGLLTSEQLSQQLSVVYFDMIRALINRNMAAGRPVYLQWNNPVGQKENFIAQGLSTHPEGLALRVDAQPFTGPPPDPQFDWRGILTDVVPKDDLSMPVIGDYPIALDRLAAHASQNNHPTEAARFTDLARQVREALGLPTR